MCNANTINNYIFLGYLIEFDIEIYRLKQWI